MKKTVSREVVLAIDDSKVELVSVPEWGEGAVIGVKCLTGVERDSYAQWVGENIEAVKGTSSGKTAMKMALLVRTLCDEEGACLFTELDVLALQVKSGAVLNRLFDKAMELNGLSESAKEEIRKNSDMASAPSGSGSPLVLECPSPAPSEK